ncbi:MAG: flagellar biosynthetic protein FliO [Leptospiraceae bacterium]|nr:flagellar biosynthetic protein FliO [Leptospiraceae bacterium]MCP5497620.1 flagellar biosynthetic protein FliO [Leptospiraceae bacterium]
MFGLYSESDLDDINSELKKELGTPPEKKPEKEPEEKEIPKKIENRETQPNPIEDRYLNRKENEESLIWILIKIIFIFGFLTAAMYYVLKYIAKNRNSRFPAQDSMKLLASLPLASNKQLQIVDISGMLLLIGVSDNSVNLIKEIVEPDIKTQIYQVQDSYEGPTESFFDLALKSFQNLDLKSHFTSSQNKESNVSYEKGEDEIVDEIKMRQMEILEKIKKERKNLTK